MEGDKMKTKPYRKTFMHGDPTMRNRKLNRELVRAVNRVYPPHKFTKLEMDMVVTDLGSIQINIYPNGTEDTAQKIELAEAENGAIN
jgi:hypothetical protein